MRIYIYVYIYISTLGDYNRHKQLNEIGDYEAIDTAVFFWVCTRIVLL